MSASTESGTIYIVDDDESFLRSVSRLLRAEGHAVQVFDSAEHFLAILTPGLSGCVLTDLQMPGLNGLELQAALLKSGSHLPVIFLSAQGDIPQTVQAMRHGAEDFLTKLSPKEDLLAAIGRALAREARERKEREHLSELRRRFKELTPREQEVLEQVLRGRMNKEIAEDLGINDRTVKMHRTNLTRKLQVHSAVELTRLVTEAGLLK